MNYCYRLFFSVLLLLPCLVNAQEIMKVMAYNLLNYDVTQADTATRNPYFRTIMDEVQPDILVCEEIVSQAGIEGFLAHVMQDVNSTYALGDYITGYDTNNALIYRSDEFAFLGNHVITTDLRDINEFTLIHFASGDTLRIYAMHLKASSGASEEAQRALEIDSLRKRTNALPPNSNFIVCGDMNIYSSNEAAYQNVLQDNVTDDGNANDPLTLTGVWNNSAYAIYHTQSPRTRSFGGGVTGGLDDRFDLILPSNALMQPGGITYVSGSTIAYGNDGNHYNDSINAPPNTAVTMTIADALHYASDHLPVIALFDFEDTGIHTPADETQLTIAPNPFTNALHLTFSAPVQSAMEIYLMDVWGRTIANTCFGPGPNYNFNLPDVPSGMYFYRVYAGRKLFQGKVVKE